jgi:hypothetical protein
LIVTCKNVVDDCPWLRVFGRKAIERGWLWKHESGTYVKLTQAGADLSTCPARTSDQPLTVVRIIAPDFAATFETANGVVRRADPAIAYLVGWTDDEVREFVYFEELARRAPGNYRRPFRRAGDIW